jgi:hypothetical protein
MLKYKPAYAFVEGGYTRIAWTSRRAITSGSEFAEARWSVASAASEHGASRCGRPG